MQSDDMEKIFPEIEQADMIVFASPLYFFSWPTQIKSVIDRLYPYALEKSERSVAGKECALLLAAATDVQEEAKGMLESYRILAEYMHWHSVGEVVAYGVDKKGDVRNTAYLEQAQEVLVKFLEESGRRCSFRTSSFFLFTNRVKAIGNR